MLQMKPGELKSIISKVRQDIIHRNPELNTVRLTWTFYGWLVEVSLNDLNVDVQALKWSVEEEMEKVGLELTKILLEV